MNLEARQSLQQRQELQLSLFQTQSLQILQMPTVELVQHIQQEAEKNPFLEIDMTTPENFVEEISPSNDFKYRERDYFTDLSQNPEISEWIESKFNNLRERESLRGHLIKQLEIDIKDPLEKQIGESIIASIDKRGYFTGDIEEIAREYNVDTEMVEDLLRKIQNFDPPGVGARDIKECLLIQIAQYYPDNQLFRKLVEQCFEELTHRQIPKIARKLKIQPADVEELIKQLKTLNPFPGHALTEEPDCVIPDVIVQIDENDELVIEIYDRHLPKVKYVEVISKDQIKNLPPEDKEQIKKLKESANQLIKYIDLRNKTLYNVAREIVIFQEEFMRKGEEYLKPLTYKTIADRLGIHESTISRCIAGKYMSTPQGIFEFRYFFPSGIKKNEDDNELSSQIVKSVIKRIIDEEDKTKPLSDQQIAELVQKQEGIKIARRTVSKYRKEMNIPNAFERKVYAT